MRDTVYQPHERPEVVCRQEPVDGAWHYGELRKWKHERDGSWSAQDLSWYLSKVLATALSEGPSAWSSIRTDRTAHGAYPWAVLFAGRRR